VIQTKQQLNFGTRLLLHSSNVKVKPQLLRSLLQELLNPSRLPLRPQIILQILILSSRSQSSLIPQNLQESDEVALLLEVLLGRFVRFVNDLGRRVLSDEDLGEIEETGLRSFDGEVLESGEDGGIEIWKGTRRRGEDEREELARRFASFKTNGDRDEDRVARAGRRRAYE